MPGDLRNGMTGGAGGLAAAGPAAVAAPGPRVVPDDEKKLVADWLKRVEGAKTTHKDQLAQFETNRKLLRGRTKDGKKIKQNLFLANLFALRPQVYAKDPEYSITPSKAVGEKQLPAAKLFCQTAEAVLTKTLVKDGSLKRRAKRLITSAYATGVGWLKCSWQDGRSKTNPIIANRLKDTQDNLARLQAMRDQLRDPQACSDIDLQTAKLKEMLAGLQTQAEVIVERGLTLDFVRSEDLLCLDVSVFEFSDYLRSSALAQRTWMTPEGYATEFGYKPEKAKSFPAGAAGGAPVQDGNGQQGNEKGRDLLCVWEIWDQDSNRVFTVCEGEEGFCRAPYSPEWAGRRWYPFFGLAFNEAEGSFYPLSDVELTEPQITEINAAQDDFQRDRKAALPVNVARKGGALTDADCKRIQDRNGSELIVVEGVGGRPLSEDIFIGQLVKLAGENYDTTAARSFMEMIVGGGDAARGSVMKAKTATEAEIMSQGLRGRSAERQDTMEDLLEELGVYALQVDLRMLTPAEVQRIAGPDAQWPALSVDDVFELVQVEVRAGSTGKPDRLQEQDRWTQLLPQIKETMQQVSELRTNGQGQLAEVLIELLRETLRRFDERLDLDALFPPPAQQPGGQSAPSPELAAAMKEIEALKAQLAEKESAEEKSQLDAAVKLAVSPQPGIAIPAFMAAMQAVEAAEAEPMEPGEPPEAGEPGETQPMGMPPNGGETQPLPPETQPEQQAVPMSPPQNPPTAGDATS